jgi:hypothetical protein
MKKRPTTPAAPPPIQSDPTTSPAPSSGGLPSLLRPLGVPLHCREADSCHAARRSPAPRGIGASPMKVRPSPRRTPTHQSDPTTSPAPAVRRPLHPCYAPRAYPCSAARQIPATPQGVPLPPERRDTPHAPILTSPHGTPRGGLPALVASGLPRWRYARPPRRPQPTRNDAGTTRPPPPPSGGLDKPLLRPRAYPCSAARQIPATPPGVPLPPERRDTPHAPVLTSPHDTPRGGLPALVASGLPR